MRKYFFILFPLLAFVNLSQAQKKPITVEEVYANVFGTEGLDALRSMKNGQQYTVLNRDPSTGATTVDKYDYATLKKVETIVGSNDLTGVDYFSGYTFSADESKLLLATEVESIYRRSTLAIYYVYDIETKEVIRVADRKIQEPALSPDGKKVAYVAENNLYLFDIESKTHQAGNHRRGQEQNNQWDHRLGL